MQIQLIEGHFDTKEALEILTQLIHVKIRFHENKIQASSHEEDIKMREKRIKHLQKDLYELRKLIESHSGTIDLHAKVEVQLA
ncbi:MAG: hypothetical protein U0Y10_10935 [Spirosomataceae bacterium]